MTYRKIRNTVRDAKENLNETDENSVFLHLRLSFPVQDRWKRFYFIGISQ